MPVSKSHLKPYFEEVLTLEHFLKSRVNLSTFLMPKDSEQYVNFLKVTVIGIPAGESVRQLRVKCGSQIPYDRSLIRIIEELHIKGGEHILTRGSRDRSRGTTFRTKKSILTPTHQTHPDAPSLEFNTVNSGLEELKTKNWRILYERVGDVLLYAIKNLSLFVPIYNQDRCLLQITGRPLEYLTVKNWTLKDIKGAYRYHLPVPPTYLYATDLREAFPRNFIPSGAANTEGAVEKILRNILAINVVDRTPRAFDCPKTIDQRQLIQWLNLFVKKHRKMEKKLKHMIRTRFPVPEMTRMNLEKLAQSFYREDKIHAFLFHYLQGAVPRELLGTPDNFSRFLQNLRVLLKRKRNESYSMGELMKGIKISKIWWTKDYEDEATKTKMAAKVIRWLLNYVMAIMQGYFYVTETSMRTVPSGTLVFYRKAAWAELVRRGIRDCRAQGLLTLVSKESLPVVEREALGTTRVRFLPKPSSLRPIQMMGSKKTGGSSINGQLGPVKDTLRWVLTKNSPCHQNFLEFAENIAKKNPRPRLYYLRFDIEKCYDNLDGSALLKMVENELKSVPNHLLYTRKIAVAKLRQGITKYFQNALPEDEITGIHTYISRLAEQLHLKDIVVCDKMFNQSRKVDGILKTLERHIKTNMVKFHVKGRAHIQRKGVSQGSIAAGSMCDLSFVEMEKTYPIKSDEFYRRHVDDVLFVTTIRKRCRTLFKHFNKGPVSVSLSKSSTNCPGIPVEYNDDDVVTSLGITFDLKHLTLYPEIVPESALVEKYRIYSRQRPGVVLKRKLIGIMSSRVKAVYYHPKVNTPELIIRKTYTAFTSLMCLWKGINRKLQLTFDANAKYFLEIVKALYGLFSKFVTTRLSKVGVEKFMLSQNQVAWICLTAVKEGQRTSWKSSPIFYNLVMKERQAVTKKLVHEDLKCLRYAVGKKM